MDPSGVVGALTTPAPAQLYPEAPDHRAPEHSTSPHVGYQRPAMTARADALSHPTPTGLFRVDLTSRTWWWSEETYRIYGFEPGEVVPTQELVLMHKHPEDVERARAAIEQAHGSETPFSCLHRILDARGDERLVLAVGRGHRATGEDVTAVTGYVCDLTRSVDRLAAVVADGHIADAARSRGVIEQAKGVLGVARDVGEAEAFAMLSRASMRTNVPVRTLAGWLLDFARRQVRQGRAITPETVDAFLASPQASEGARPS